MNSIAGPPVSFTTLAPKSLPLRVCCPMKACTPLRYRMTPTFTGVPCANTGCGRMLVAKAPAPVARRSRRLGMARFVMWYPSGVESAGLALCRRGALRVNIFDSLDDRQIPGTAAQIAPELGPDTVPVEIRNAGKHVVSCRQHAGRTEPALQRMPQIECFSDGRHQVVALIALDRPNLRAV